MKKTTRKSILSVLMAFLLCMPVVAFFSGCRGYRPHIVVSIFPAYDWTRVILGSNPNDFRVRYLMEDGIDLHFFSPSIQDTTHILNSELFIYIGDMAEPGVLPIIRQNPQVNYLSMMELVETRQLEWAYEDHECDDDCFHANMHDKHVWLSLKMARVIVEEIAQAIARLDPANADYYLANADAYNALLFELDLEFEQMVQQSPRDTIVFADRFPFLYLLDDYNIIWHAGTNSCDSNFQPTLAMRTRLEGVVRELDLDVILILEDGLRQNFAEQIVANTGATRVKVLNSLQTMNLAAANRNNVTYLSAMQENLAVLREALA